MSVHSLVLEDLRYGLLCDLHIGEHLGASLKRCMPLLPEPDRSDSLRDRIHAEASYVPMAWCLCMLTWVCMLACCKFCVLPGMIITAPVAAPATGMCASPSNVTFAIQQESKACMIKHSFKNHLFVSKTRHLSISFSVVISVPAKHMPSFDRDSFSPSEPPHLQHELDDILAKTLSVGYRYVRSLKSGGGPDQTLRKGLMEAASRLLQLSTDPKEYLEQLAGNVRYVCVTFICTCD